jgi:hypothetical protein
MLIPTQLASYLFMDRKGARVKLLYFTRISLPFVHPREMCEDDTLSKVVFEERAAR